MLRKWTGVILGQPYSKANSRRWVANGRIIKSAPAIAYCNSAKAQLVRVRPKEMLSGYLCVEMWVTYKTWRPDLDESLVLDLLQGIVYANDRYVVEKHIYRMPNDNDEPKTKVMVTELGEDYYA